MHTRTFRFLVMVVVQISGVFNIQLSPTQVNVVENSSAILTCSDSNGYLIESIWKNSQIGEANVFYYHNKCIATSFLHENEFLAGMCNGDGTYSVVLKRINRTQHDAEWSCRQIGLPSSNKVIIHVSVPASSVLLIGQNRGYIQENETDKIICNTSACRPNPRIQWYLRNNQAGEFYNLTQFSTNTYVVREFGLKAVESILNFKPNRTVNGFHLYCDVWTRSDKADITSREIALNVIYPPKHPPKIDEYEDVKRYTLIDSEVGKLSCNIYGGNPLPKLTWNCYNNTQTPDDIDGKSVTKNVTWIVARVQTSCSCISIHSWTGTTQSTNISIDVLYPPQKPTFKIGETNVSDIFNIILNNTLQVMCESKSNPAPNFTWTGPLISQRLGQVLIVKIDDTNDRIYKCVAKNIMIRSDSTFVHGQNEANVIVKVLYPPVKPSFKFEYTNGTQASFYKMIAVIEGDTFTILCDAGGNPPSTLQWDGQTRRSALKITSILSDTNKTCTAKYKMEETVGETKTGSTSATISIEVLYPPKNPTINISNGTRKIEVTTPSVQLIEMDSINITCFSEAKPAPNYKWTVRNTTILHNICQFANISRTDAGRYNCHVNNLMKRTFGEAKAGSNFSSISLDIMYPSIIQSLIDESILEGSNLTIICRVQQGNPTKENVSWTRTSDSMDWRSNQLTIDNVSRADDSSYTCIFKSTIIPTIGNEKVLISKKNIHVNVFFPTEIKHFFVNRNESSETFIINQTDEVSLHCYAESNPASDLSIIYPPGITILTVKNKNVLRYKITNASFENAGIYTCEGRNNYTKYRPSTSKLILIVKSPPRPSPYSKFENKVAAALSTNKTLQFVAQPYLDEQNKTSFMWFKQNISVPRNETRFEVSSNGLYSNLSVRSITKNDFGQYCVKVTNSVGEYIHYYGLKVEDKPDMPIRFTYISESVTESSVTLTWTPGFNGGFPQMLILLYRVSQEKKWQSISVKDNNKETMNYTLTGLLSAKVYNIKICAKNELGNSSFTHILRFTTRAMPIVHVTSTGTFVGVGIGTFAGTVMIVVASLLCYKRLRRKLEASYKDSLPSGSVHFANSSSLYEDLDSSKRNENVYNLVFVSDTNEQNDSQVQQLSTFTGTDSSTDNVNDASIYVNLKI